MTRRMIAAALFAAASGFAQWLDFPMHVPRTADGKPNLSAPAPKRPDGKPDLSGIWETKPGYLADLAKDYKSEDIFQPWAAALYKHRRDTLSRDDPQARCVLSGVPREDVVPYPFKILHTDGGIVILYEALHSYRQIFMDGRQLPKNPNPTWMGYSIGRWDGDTLVVQSSGFVDGNWLDNNGHPGTEAMHLTERFHRRDFGHIDLLLTVDDPKAYTKPWDAKLELILNPSTELIEYVCDENEKDVSHLVGNK